MQLSPTELETLKVSTLLRKFAVPGIIAQTASSLYNMIDCIFIGHIPDVGSLAISGLAVTFPLMNISVALGTLVGVGAMTMISILMGQKKLETANKVLGSLVTLNIIIGVLFTIFTLLFLDPILTLFGASPNTLPFARDYMVIILLGNIITHLYFGLNGVIRASGHPKTAMNLTLFTVISNAILDPVFIFVFKLGIQGAAIATVLCQLLAFIYTIHFFRNKDRVIHFPHPALRLDLRVAKSSLSIGMAPFLMNMAACMVSLLINRQLLKYGGDLYIGAYGILNRLTFLFVMIVLGLNQGMQPIVGYNYGAKLYSRVKETSKLSIIFALGVTTLCFLVSELIPRTAASLFTNDPQMIELAVRAFRIGCSMFFINGFSMVSTSLFQYLGMPKKAVFLSLTRQLIFLVPFLCILPLFLKQDGIWLSIPLSDLVSFIIALLFIRALFKKLSRLKDGDDPSMLGGSV